jgi:hypothetical protein
MRRYNDLAGKRFGRLEVISNVKKPNDPKTYWLCKCDCGKEKVIGAQNLKLGKAVSCGCYGLECLRKYTTTHGNSTHPLYKTWYQIMKRCYDKNHKDYKYYGERGITACDSWKDNAKNFFNDMGDKPENTTLDRIDNNKGYSKENCRWVSSGIQGSNKRNNKNFIINGKKIHLSEISRVYGIKETTLSNRLKAGANINEAIKNPVREINKTLTYKGITKKLGEWAKEINVSRKTIQNRLDAGWDMDDVINKKSRSANPRRPEN